MIPDDNRRYYYYPLTTKDFTFESIFSSESVSPCSFYEERGFGADFCYLIPGYHHRDALILYNAPPIYETGTNINVIKFILKIAEQSINQQELLVVDEGMVAYPGTIYLSPDNCEVLFLTAKDKTVTTLKVETSLTTKGLKKYERSLQVIDDENAFKKFDTSAIVQLKVDGQLRVQAISADRQFNYFKGFVYGIASGLAGYKSEMEIRLKKSLQEMINGFAELKNRSDNRPKTTSRYSRPGSFTSNASELSDAKLKNTIKEAAKLFSEHFPGRPFSQSGLVEFLRIQFSHRLPTIEDAHRFVNYMMLADEIFQTDQFQRLKTYYYKHSADSNPLFFFDMVDQQLDQFMAAVRAGQSRQMDVTYEQFKNAVFELNRFLDGVLLKQANTKTIDLSPIHYDSATNSLQISDDFLDMSPGNLEEFIYISNVILQHPKSGRGDADKQIILSMVDQVGSSFGKKVSGKSTHLYQYLNNEVTEYSFEKVSSVVMQNFVAFVFNPDSAEKLDSYLEARLIAESWMAYAFWCAFNGFTGTSRNLVKPVFESGNRTIQNYLDKYLAEQYATISVLPAISPTSVIKKKIETNEIVPAITEKDDDKDKLFYQSFIDGKVNLSFNDFLSIIQMRDKETILKVLSKKHKIGKKEGGKIIDNYNGFMESALLF